MSIPVVLHLHIAALLLGGTALFSKLIPFTAWDIISYRALFCAIIIVTVCLIFKRTLSVQKKLFPLILLTSILFGVHWTAYFQAMQLSSVAIGMISMFTFPVMTVFIEPLFNKRKIKAYDVLMGALVVFGVVMMVPVFDLENSTFIGICAGLISALAVALRNIIVSKHLKSAPSATIMFYHATFTFLLMLPFCKVGPDNLSLENLGLLILLGTIFTAIPHTQKTYALSYLSAKSVSMIISLQVVYGCIFAYIILDESINNGTLIGGAAILFAGLSESFKPTVKKP